MTRGSGCETPHIHISQCSYHHIASGGIRERLLALIRKCQHVSSANVCVLFIFIHTRTYIYEISILFLGSQLCFLVLYEMVFVKLKVTVMQVPKAIKGGSTCMAALNVINHVSGLQVFHGESGGMSIWGLFWVFSSSFFIALFNVCACQSAMFFVSICCRRRMKVSPTEARFVLSSCRGNLNRLEGCPEEDTHHLGKTR